MDWHWLGAKPFLKAMLSRKLWFLDCYVYEWTYWGCREFGCKPFAPAKYGQTFKSFSKNGGCAWMIIWVYKLTLWKLSGISIGKSLRFHFAFYPTSSYFVIHTKEGIFFRPRLKKEYTSILQLTYYSTYHTSINVYKIKTICK